MKKNTRLRSMLLLILLLLVIFFLSHAVLVLISIATAGDVQNGNAVSDKNERYYQGIGIQFNEATRKRQPTAAEKLLGKTGAQEERVVVIFGVLSNSSAGRAGIKEYYIIDKIDGRKVEGMEITEIQELIGSLPNNKQIFVEFKDKDFHGQPLAQTIFNLQKEKVDKVDWLPLHETLKSKTIRAKLHVECESTCAEDEVKGVFIYKYKFTNKGKEDAYIASPLFRGLANWLDEIFLKLEPGEIAEVVLETESWPQTETVPASYFLLADMDFQRDNIANKVTFPKNSYYAVGLSYWRVFIPHFDLLHADEDY